MSMKIAEHAVRAAIKANLQGKLLAPGLLREVLNPNAYAASDLDSLDAFFSAHPIDVLTHYTPKLESQLAVYVSEGSVTLQESYVGGSADVDELAQIEQAITPDSPRLPVLSLNENESALFKKGVRVICLAQNHDVMTALTSIVQYILMAHRNVFDGMGLQNMTLESPEIDFLREFFPQDLFRRSTLLTFDVIDTFKVGSFSAIKTITVDNVNLIEGEIQWTENL